MTLQGISAGAAVPSSPAGRQLSAGVVENPIVLGQPKGRTTAEPLEISGVVRFLVSLAEDPLLPVFCDGE